MSKVVRIEMESIESAVFYIEVAAEADLDEIQADLRERHWDDDRFSKKSDSVTNVIVEDTSETAIDMNLDEFVDDLFYE